jgi:hypothetical protein
MSDEKQQAAHEHFVRGIGESTRHNALAYGYSIALTGTFGLLTILDRAPHVGDVFLFGLGAAIVFTIANAAVTRGFRVRVQQEPPIVLAFGTSLGFISVSGALGAAALVAKSVPGAAGWLVGPFVASGAYLVLSALEFVLARAVRAVVGVEHLEEHPAEEEGGS